MAKVSQIKIKIKMKNYYKSFHKELNFLNTQKARTNL